MSNFRTCIMCSTGNVATTLSSSTAPKPPCASRRRRGSRRSACWTDLGDAGERAAGYYARPWDWAAIRRNAGSIHQWHGDDDPFIPLAEARHVAENLGSAYAELPGRSHFFSPPFPELAAAVAAVARRGA